MTHTSQSDLAYDLHQPEFGIYYDWSVTIKGVKTNGSAGSWKAGARAIRRAVRRRLGWRGYWRVRRCLP